MLVTAVFTAGTGIFVFLRKDLLYENFEKAHIIADNGVCGRFCEHGSITCDCKCDDDKHYHRGRH